MKKHVRLKGTVCFSVCNGSFLLKEQGRSFFIHSINKSGLSICKNKQNSKEVLLYVHYNRFQLISIRSSSIQ